MLQIGPYSAWLVVDDAGLETHAIEASDVNNSVSGWVSSEEGKKFSIYWHNAIRDVALEAVVTIDGIECNRHVMLDAYNFPDKPDTVRVSYARTSDFTRRDFVFSVIQVTDDDDYLDTLDHGFKFGVITLDLWRIHINNVVREPLQHEYGAQVLGSQLLHERSKKAGTHHVKFGEEYIVPRPTVDMVDGQKMDTVPYISFTFKYRPQSILLAQGIITLSSNEARTSSDTLRSGRNTGYDSQYRQERGQYAPSMSHPIIKTEPAIYGHTEFVDLT